jgi:hypothetical protein
VKNLCGSKIEILRYASECQIIVFNDCFWVLKGGRGIMGLSITEKLLAITGGFAAAGFKPAPLVWRRLGLSGQERHGRGRRGFWAGQPYQAECHPELGPEMLWP